MVTNASDHSAAPGAVICDAGFIALNAGRESIMLSVTNTGDRPIQVGSHFHFFEVNRMLQFERDQALGFRLDIPAGPAVRFDPGEVLIGDRRLENAG